MKKETKILSEVVTNLTHLSNVLEGIRKKFPKSYSETFESQKNLVVAIDLLKTTLKQAESEDKRLRQEQQQDDRGEN